MTNARSIGGRTPEEANQIDILIGIEVIPYLASLPSAMRYDTWITKRPLDNDKFIPLNIHLSLRELENLVEEEVGDIAYEVSEFEAEIKGQIYRPKELYASRFFPFGAFPERYASFLGKGVADFIQLIVARDLLERFGNQSKAIHKHPSETRQNQLNRLGIQKDVGYNLREYVEIIAQSVEKRGKK
jgi:hypothetical protein